MINILLLWKLYGTDFMVQMKNILFFFKILFDDILYYLFLKSWSIILYRTICICCLKISFSLLSRALYLWSHSLLMEKFLFIHVLSYHLLYSLCLSFQESTVLPSFKSILYLPLFATSENILLNLISLIFYLSIHLSSWNGHHFFQTF